MADLLTVDHVSKRFANHLALDDVSLSVPAGSVFGLLGPNGAGKTTLIRIINQITGPDEGTVMMNGKAMNEDLVHKVGYLPEERGLYKKMKVGEQAMYLARLKGLSREEAAKRLKTWFDKFEIGAWWNRKVEELSKGMQQKLQFIVTVVHNPELLIFDEPFSGFDPINVNLIKDEILKLKKDGATILFSTHNMASVEELCDHIGLIDRSRKILEGEVSAIKKSYRSFTYEFSYASTDRELASIVSPGIKVLQEEQADGITVGKVQLPNEDVKGELLHTMVSETDLYSFQELFPSINDIFISKVKENQRKETPGNE